MRDKDRQSPESNGRPSLTREAMVARLFVKIGSPCLFWISTLPGPTPHPTPCSLGSFTSWPTQISKVCWITTVLWICSSAFCCVFSCVLLVILWRVSDLLNGLSHRSVCLFHSIRAMSAGDRPGVGKEGSRQLRWQTQHALHAGEFYEFFSTLCGLVSCFIVFQTIRPVRIFMTGFKQCLPVCSVVNYVPSLIKNKFLFFFFFFFFYYRLWSMKSKG